MAQRRITISDVTGALGYVPLQVVGTATAGQALVWNGTAWAPGTVAGGGGSSISLGAMPLASLTLSPSDFTLIDGDLRILSAVPDPGLLYADAEGIKPVSLVGATLNAGTLTVAPTSSLAPAGTATLGGVVANPGTAGQFVTGIDSATGRLVFATPAPAYALPAAGTATLGGVIANPGTAGQFVTGVNPVNGQLQFSTPTLPSVSLTLDFSGLGPMVAGTWRFTGYAARAFTVSGLLSTVGGSGGSFTVNIRNAGASVQNLGSLVVNTSTLATTTAGATNAAVAAGAVVDVVVTAVSGTPSDALLCLVGS